MPEGYRYRAPPCRGRTRGHAFSSPSDDEAGGTKARYRADDVRPADLQEEPTKHFEKPEASLTTQSFRRIRRTRRPPANIAASWASHSTQRAPASQAIKNALGA